MKRKLDIETGTVGIYKLTIKSHKYVGSSVDLRKRLNCHIRQLERGVHDNEYLQRCVNKYGLVNLKWEILEIEDSKIKYADLLEREKYFINLYKADLNLKLDPTTQTNCKTTSKVVYQFNQFGELIKAWPSTSEAARNLKINESNIHIACVKRNRQRIAGGFLWDFEPKYTGKINLIYIFDLNRNFVNKYTSTADIYTELYSNLKRKTVLSQLRKHIDTNIPYLQYYLSSIPNITINKKIKIKSNKEKELESILKTNPIIYCFDKSGKMLYYKHFFDFANKSYIKKSLLSENHYRFVYTLNPNQKIITTHPRAKKVVAKNIITGEIFKFKTIQECAQKIFGHTQGSHITKYIDSNKPFHNFLLYRDL